MVNIVAIKYSVKNTEHGAASGGEQPQPGLYTGEISEIKHRTNRGQGKEDDLEVIYKIVGEEKNYARIWDYVGLENDSTEWKRAQFLEAVGVANATNREGEFNPEKLTPKFNGKETSRSKGVQVKLRIRGDSYNGEYKAKVAAVLPIDDEAGSGGSEDKDDPFA